jgi:hypothetical protein
VVELAVVSIRWDRMSDTCDCASETLSGEAASTMIELNGPYPVSACCTAVRGAMARSLASMKPEALPFSSSTPTTVKSAPLTVISSPIGSTPGNSSSATVCPITTTRRPCFTSSSVNAEPLDTGELDAPK